MLTNIASADLMLTNSMYETLKLPEKKYKQEEINIKIN